MRLSTSTCIHEHILWQTKNGLHFTAEDSIRACARAGFRVLDFNFASYSRKGLPMTQPDWESWVKRQKELSDSLNIEYVQGHAHFYLWSPAAPHIKEEDEELIRRSIIGAGIMGVKWLVIHPGNIDDETGNSDYGRSLQLNLDQYQRYAELASREGVGIAIENLPNHGERGRFATDERDLLTLMEKLADPIFGICWDTGHGHMNVPDQSASLRAIAPYLHALHIADNHGSKDEHIAPFFGTIDWDPIMRTLREIEYPGEFTFEIHNHTNGMPEGMHDKAIRFAYDIGMFLLNSVGI